MPKSNKSISKIKIDKSINTELFEILRSRFEQNIHRHKDIYWKDVEHKLKTNKSAQESLSAMESTGGEPDVIDFKDGNKGFVFVDCAIQSPDRRKICYDRLAEQNRIKKGIHPGGNAIDLSIEMGIDILDEHQYRYLQSLDDFDTKTSTWLKTPEELRVLGGAIFGDKRYGRTFVYHNSAESFYSDRAFRGILKL